MESLSFDEILKEHQTRDASSISSLQLSKRGLSKVLGFNEFSILERLDLSCNNLSTLEGLKSCVNLKWLSVVENKLQSLKGVESLSKLTVLNAGRNILTSMDEVKSLTSLRALMLNDNDISSICRLDRLSFLNTLVLSRNPIQDIGKSLAKGKSIAKLSLSNCQLQTIGLSLISCVDLKELRLAHNRITLLHVELAHNAKLQILDLGNNMIRKWSSIKVISNLHDLKNLNLQGNPIVEKSNLAVKVHRKLPSIRIFNGHPIESTIADPNLSKETILQNPDKEAGSKEEKSKRKKSKKNEKLETEVIDDRDSSFVDIIVSKNHEEPEESEKKISHRGDLEVKKDSGLVAVLQKQKKAKRKHEVKGSATLLVEKEEIGMGGPSLWDS
ncbi:protein phosphatase 1 regulatory subunit 7 isoform X5 [Amborella trichopoda]|uniref:protein phosphatase 1 regulatory subunit 7 isoform X5 n=1 Tax=Amborella trichopoda TaxID=13333 RepID=UPI0005D30EDD|nr:protein phosphatase 1 regulatory subunit 7 isoform X5 [Amborella trichopoda]|eukprot:XP_020518415.1 protein phosphatase 1 regulatory subunit 7 isoform X5 [Amborella trichopoda]